MCLSNGVLWFGIYLMGRLLLSSAGYFVTAEVKHFLFFSYIQDFNLLILIKSLLLFNYHFYRDSLY